MYIYGVDGYDGTNPSEAQTLQKVINEIKESVESISNPYEINLTNLLSAEDSESISTVIGGIDNLNATVQDNRIIVGTISNGSVSVSIRILGNVTTLYYLLDSVVGLTLNEIAIINTSGILSKSVTTHSVLTENMVIDSLTSDETTLPLSAAQGKVLDSKITTLQTNLNTKQNSTDNNLDTTDKTIVGAINELLSKAIGVGKIDASSNGTGEIFNSYEGENTNIASGNFSHAEGHRTTASGDRSHAEGSSTNANGTNSHAEGDHTQTFSQSEHAEGIYNKSYNSLNASLRVIHSVGIGSEEPNRKNAHEIKFNGDHYVYGVGSFDGTNSVDAQTLQEVINGKQDTLVSGTSIKTINGESLLGSGDIKITGGSSEVTWDNVTGKPTFATVATSGAYSDLTGTPNLSSYQTKSDETLQTTNKTIVGAINELLAKVQELETKNTELESRLAALEGTN